MKYQTTAVKSNIRNLGVLILSLALCACAKVKEEPKPAPPHPLKKFVGYWIPETAEGASVSTIFQVTESFEMKDIDLNQVEKGFSESRPLLVDGEKAALENTVKPDSAEDKYQSNKRYEFEKIGAAKLKLTVRLRVSNLDRPQDAPVETSANQIFLQIQKEKADELVASAESTLESLRSMFYEKSWSLIEKRTYENKKLKSIKPAREIEASQDFRIGDGNVMTIYNPKRLLTTKAGLVVFNNGSFSTLLVTESVNEKIRIATSSSEKAATIYATPSISEFGGLMLTEEFTGTDGSDRQVVWVYQED